MYWTLQNLMYSLTFILFCLVITTCDTITSISSTSTPFLKTGEKKHDEVFEIAKRPYNSEGTTDDQSVEMKSNQSSTPQQDHEEITDKNKSHDVHWNLILLLIGSIFLITLFVIIIIKVIK